MLKNKKIDHINMQVPNLAEAKKWYMEELGFSEEGHFKNSHMEMLYLKSNEGIIYEFVENENITKPFIEHIAYQSEDIQKDFEYCTANDYRTSYREIAYIDFLWENGVYYFMVLTPTNELIEFCQKK